MLDIESNIPAGVVSLNVGGQFFATSRATLIREPLSMLARMFSSPLKNRADDQGRIFIDRDPKYFRLILNYLRDGTCVLPVDEADILEVLQEVEFYQLEGLKSFILGEDTEPVSAQRLRICITQQIQMDPQLIEATNIIVQCAFGKGSRDKIPARRAVVEVVVRETAFNPLFPQPHVQARDEMLYVAFQQHIKFEGKMDKRAFFSKHEPHFIHEEGSLSYDPKVYGGSYQDRLHIKTLEVCTPTEVYRHHCLHQLSEQLRNLRDAALFIERNADAVQWALETYGFRDVRLAFHLRQPELCDVPDSPPASPSNKPQDQHTSPVLCNVRFDVHLSL